MLADLIASNVVPVVRLTEIFRQASESRIITAVSGPRILLVGINFNRKREVAGGRVIAAAGTAEKLDLARQLGADVLVDYTVPTALDSVARPLRTHSLSPPFMLRTLR